MRRAGLWVLSISLWTVVLIGCGSSFQGSLTGRNGDGTGPKPAPGQAQITAVSPSSVAAETGPFTLTVTGANFVPSTVVMWNNTISLTTTYVSSTKLTAEVPAALIVTPTTVNLDPSPIGTFNYGANLTITAPTLSGNDAPLSISEVAVAANDLEWDATSQQFYVSIASTNAVDANSIAAIDPRTAALGPTVSTRSEPDKLAISTDGSYLYAGLNSTGSVDRYTLPGLQSDISISLGSDAYGSYYAIDVQAEPDSSHSIAVTRGVSTMSPRELGGVVIYDDAIARPQSVPGFGAGPGPLDALVWNASGSSLYGVDDESGTGLYIMSVSSAGAQLQSQARSGGTGNTLHIDPATGYLYTNSGVVTDPGTDAVVGTFPLGSVQGGFSNTVMTLDGKLGIAYFLGGTLYSGPGNYVLAAFDLKSRTLVGAVAMNRVSGTPSKIVRWGTNGLAFLTGDTYGHGAVGDGVYLVSGDFVTSPAP